MKWNFEGNKWSAFNDTSHSLIIHPPIWYSRTHFKLITLTTLKIFSTHENCFFVNFSQFITLIDMSSLCADCTRSCTYCEIKLMMLIELQNELRKNI